jgi:hypothetical protein
MSLIDLPGSPVLMSVQVPPESVERQMRPLSEPEYTTLLAFRLTSRERRLPVPPVVSPDTAVQDVP